MFSIHYHGCILSTHLPGTIAQLLENYEYIFIEPIVLPLVRPRFDHKVPMKEGAQPFNLGPYISL